MSAHLLRAVQVCTEPLKCSLHGRIEEPGAVLVERKRMKVLESRSEL